MSGIYFDQYQIGQSFLTHTRTVTETDVVMFAALSGDMNELHMSEHFAKQGPFGKRIAHGLLGLSITHGLMSRIGIFDGPAIAFLNVENWRFTAPIYLGDTVHAVFKVQDKIPSRSKPDRGIIKFFVQLVNQDHVVAQEGIQVIMAKCQPFTMEDTLHDKGDEGQ